MIFLDGEFDEGIDMEQPIGSVVKGHKHKVHKLKRSNYDLKQVLR